VVLSVVVRDSPGLLRSAAVASLVLVVVGGCASVRVDVDVNFHLEPEANKEDMVCGGGGGGGGGSPHIEAG